MASKLIVENGEVKGIETAGGQRYDCDYLIWRRAAGAGWLSQEALR
jgi:hypothetical protein